MNKTEKNTTSCRNCGGKTVVGELKPAKGNSTFEHIVLKCRTCGTWCGGITKPRNNSK